MSALSIAADDVVDALVVGTAFLDVVLTGLPRAPNSGEEIWAHDRVLCPGGIANNAIALARLGLQTTVVAPLGLDAAGDLVADMLSTQHHLDISRLHRAVRMDTPVTVALGWGDDRAFVSHGMLDPVPLEEMAAVLPAARTCFVSLQPEGVEWPALQKSFGAEIFAGVGFDDRHGWSESILEQLSAVDTLVLNEMEALAYTREDDLDRALGRLSEQVPCVVITRGAQGVWAVDSSMSRSPTKLAAPVVAAVDATGAGDSFVSALMHGSLVGGSLDERLRYALVASGITVERLGGSHASPRLDEIVAWSRSHRSDQPDFAGIPDWLMSSPSHTPSQI